MSHPFPYGPLEILDCKVWDGGSRWTRFWLVRAENKEGDPLKDGTFYLVEFRDGRLSCSCPHGLITHSAFLDDLNVRAGQGCKHLRAVAEHRRQEQPEQRSHFAGATSPNPGIFE